MQDKSGELTGSGDGRRIALARRRPSRAGGPCESEPAKGARDMNGIPSAESVQHSGWTRRELPERSAALGAAVSIPGFRGAAAAAAATEATTPRRGGHLRIGMNDGGAGDSLAPWNMP